MIDKNDTLGAVATAHPEATQVFLRHRLDFCCGGRQKLGDACEAAGLNPDAIIAAIEAERQTGSLDRWDERPLPELVDHILDRYHAPLHRDLMPLLEAAKKVERVHGSKESCPKGLAAHFENMVMELQQHLAKEENVLFPAIMTGRRGSEVHMPIRVMMSEHDDHGEALRRLRELTTDFVPPAEACATWRALYFGLEKLETELMEHIHLENNVLFPRTLGA